MYENRKTELKKVIPFEENGHWYMRLDYEYEDESGKHLHILPKVSFPHTLENIPIIRNCFFAPIWDIAVSEYLQCSKGCVKIGNTGEEFLSEFVDILVEPKIHKMTKEEIEEKLGYQIEIVSK
jgi:hypothetical protein